MADLVFKKFTQGVDPQYNSIVLNKIADNVLREDSASGNFQTRDVVRIVYTDTYQKAVYGVCTSATGAAIFEFDENIYPVGLTQITATIYKYNSTDVDQVNAYRLGVEIENGLYSKAYTQYANNITYSLIVPSKRNEYFGVSSELFTQPNIAFADYCDNKAYGVGFSDGSFDLLNNKYKSSLEFNIATR